MKKNTKGEYLYLSTLIPDEEFNKVLIMDQSPQMATHIFNWKVYKGIKSSNLIDYNFYVISTRPITEYPRNSSKIVKAKKWETPYDDLHELFFINYSVIKTITIFISCSFQCFKWCLFSYNKLKKGVFIDTYQLPYLVCGYLISRIFKVPLIGLLTDPPNMNYKISWESSFKKQFRRMNGILSIYLIKKFTGVIALTQHLANNYCPGKKHLIIEAISEPYDNKNDLLKSKKFVVMYSGSLLKVYGIIELIKAFMKLLYTDIELWIFGKGDAEKEIIDFAKNDYRIRYFGFLENSKILNYQSIATLLINPRPTNLPDSKYSFPSKILEYMQSGTPTLLTRLPGIPDEYGEYVFFTEGYDEYNIAKSINNIYKMDRNELICFGQKAKSFVQSKNIRNQGNRMAKFIIDITENFQNDYH